MDEGALPITADVRVFIYTHTHTHTLGEAGDCTTDTEESNNLKMTKQTPQFGFLSGQKKTQLASGLRRATTRTLIFEIHERMCF